MLKTRSRQPNRGHGGADPAPASAPSFSPLRTVNVVCLILNDLNPNTRAFAFESGRKFVNNELRPNTYIGVFSLDASGLRPVFAFSDNRENLLKAVGLAAVNQLPSINLGTVAMFNGLSMSATGTAVIGAVRAIGGAEGFADGASADDPPAARFFNRRRYSGGDHFRYLSIRCGDAVAVCVGPASCWTAIC